MDAIPASEFEYLSAPIDLSSAVDDVCGAELAEAIGFPVVGGGRDHARAGGQGKLQRKYAHASRTLYKHRSAGLEVPAFKKGVPCGQRRTWKRRRFFIGESIGDADEAVLIAGEVLA